MSKSSNYKMAQFAPFLIYLLMSKHILYAPLKSLFKKGNNQIKNRKSSVVEISIFVSIRHYHKRINLIVI